MPNKYQSSAGLIPVDRAVGKILAHDITEIRPGQFKGAAFKKGHRVRPEDISHLRRLGKEHLYVLQLNPGELHEDEAAIRLARAFAGPGVDFDENPAEGKIAFKAARRGLLKVKVDTLTAINMVPNICCSSRQDNTLVERGEIVAATRAIPLIIAAEPVQSAVRLAQNAEAVFSVRELMRPSVGLVITGNEVYTGIIDDKFAPLIRKKLRSYGCQVSRTLFAPDDKNKIIGCIRRLRREGAEMIMVAGGMSVDPDDVTRPAIADAGAEDLVYGTPVLPGAMFLYARLGDIPILGIPACVLYYKATVLDLLLPRILAGEAITRRDLADMAHGGLCLNCPDCRYPVCPFGK